MNEKTKKILNLTLKIVSWVLIVFSVFMMLFTVLTVTTVDRNDRNLLGLRFYIVQSDSMSKSENNADMKVHFNAGDIIVSTKVKDPLALEPGDIISFISGNEDSFGETVTHMIRERKYENGKFVGYVTFGTNTGVNDEATVDPSFVLGKYSFRLPAAGYFFEYIRSTPGYIVCILVPLLLLILYNGLNVIRLFKKYSAEQRAEIETEKAEIEAERKQNEEMFRELQALKEQLAKQNGEQTAENKEKTSAEEGGEPETPESSD